MLWGLNRSPLGAESGPRQGSDSWDNSSLEGSDTALRSERGVQGSFEGLCVDQPNGPWGPSPGPMVTRFPEGGVSRG